MEPLLASKRSNLSRILASTFKAPIVICMRVLRVVASPIQEVFERIIEEIYWVDSLEEAEEILASYLEKIDNDLRGVLLEERRKICGNPDVVLEIVKVDALSESVEDEETRGLLLLKSLIDLLFLAQCTGTWAKLSQREKATILAPLYKAYYGFKLASKNWPESIDKIHLREAYRMIDVAYEKAEEAGIIGEIFEVIDRLSRKALEEAGGETE